MKRKEFLKLTGCNVKQLANLKMRKNLPFVPNTGGHLYDDEGKQTDYSLLDAFQMRVFLDASENKSLPLETAQYIAGNCLHHLRFGGGNTVSAEDDLWIFYAQGYQTKFADNGETWTPRKLGAGRLQDLAAFVANKLPREETQFLVSLNANLASDNVLAAAIEHGILVLDDKPLEPIWMRDYETVSNAGEA